MKCRERQKVNNALRLTEYKRIVDGKYKTGCSKMRILHKTCHSETVTDVTTVYRELLRKQVSKKFYYGVRIRIS